MSPSMKCWMRVKVSCCRQNKKFTKAPHAMILTDTPVKNALEPEAAGEGEKNRKVARTLVPKKEAKSAKRQKTQKKGHVSA